MNQRIEKMLAQVLNLTSFAMVAAAGVVVYMALTYAPPVIAFKEVNAAVQVPSEQPTGDDEIVRQLAGSKMSQTVVMKAEVAAPKPPAPKLSTIVRLKGIMDFGDPKTNEVILENVRTNQTRGYKAGQSIDGVDARIIKVENDVWIEYDGQKIKLKIDGEEAAEALPLAGQSQDALSLKKDEKANP